MTILNYKIFSSDTNMTSIRTSVDFSSQNGPVEQAHHIVSNINNSFLIGAGLPIAYWPFIFLHVLRIRNTLPGNGQGSFPIYLSTGMKDNLKNLQTFGY